MRSDSEDIEHQLNRKQRKEYYREFKIADDSRVTELGQFLRRTSLDELPQLFNVLFGSMSLIGPRPLLEKELEKYGLDSDKLLSVKPGLTGYWQAFGRNNITYSSGQRQKMELYYVDHCGYLFDIRIFLKSIAAVITQEGAKMD